MEATHSTSKKTNKKKLVKKKTKRKNSVGAETTPNKFRKVPDTDLEDASGESEEENNTNFTEITRKDTFAGQPIEQLQPSADNNSRSLVPLLMNSGSVDKLLDPKVNTWPTLASKMKSIYLPLQKKSQAPEQYYAELFTAYYAHGKEVKVVAASTGKHLGSGIDDTAQFLKDFMDANGQWTYIENQDWYQKGDFAIGIDVNYYPDRSGLKDAQPGFHKDTGGNNIFVNLVFDNTKPMESTEWFADTEQPSQTRSAWQKSLLPSAYLDELDNTRKTLKAQSDNAVPVQGGVSDGPNTYVSWVDDLVWHATPTVEKRQQFSASAAQEEYAKLDTASRTKNFGYDSQQYGSMLGVEILGTMAEAEGTELRKWLAANGKTAQDIDVTLAQQAWRELYKNNNGGKERFVADAKTREAANPTWLITGQYSEANAYDNRLAKSDSIQETPISLSSRRRANSLDTGKVQQARDANKGVERSFIRTWVRILPTSSAELKKIGGI